MSLRSLPEILDGDQAVYRFPLMDGASVRDLASAAAVFCIEDEDGNAIATRPCYIIGAKASGEVDVMLKGMETDWDGLGKNLDVSVRCYYAQAPDRTPAVNLLANPSFDTGAGTVADSWNVGSTLGDMVYEIRQDDPAPPVIFGKCQRSYAAIGSTTTAYLTQSPAGAIVAGDYFSCGVWYRASVAAGGSVVGSEHYMTLLGGANVLKTNLPATATDWTFVYATKRATDAAANSSFALVNFDAKGYEIRYDDAFLFKGTWAVFHSERRRIPVRAHSVPSKAVGANSDMIAGLGGGFEDDTNADGIADGWSRSGTGNTYTIEVDPDHVNGASGSGSQKAQKVVLGASSTERLRKIYRGRFLAGQTWRFQVAYKNSGALSGAPANGDFGIVLHTEEFDGAYEESSLAGANFALTSQAAYTNKFRTLTLTADHSVLVMDISLKTATGGTLWLDDALLYRSA